MKKIAAFILFFAFVANVPAQLKVNSAGNVGIGTAKSIGYDFSGVDVDEIGIYGLRYAEFVVPLVKAVQELSEQNEQLKAQIEELTKRVNSLQGK